MGLEVATYISDLVTTNPPTSDLETQGANHLQLIKTVLQNVFGITSRRFVGLPNFSAQSLSVFNVGVGNANLTFLYSTAGGPVTFNLPTLLPTDAGWEISLIKTTTDVNPVFITPPSGTIQSGEYSGLTKVRRCIPGRRTRIMWTGSIFICERVENRPIGTIFDFSFAGLPVGYEWSNGQVLSSAANYPEYFAVNGSGNTVDMRGRAAFGLDNPGGTGNSGRITVAGGNFDGTVIDSFGGAQNHVLSTAEMPAHNHTGSGNVSDPTHGHTLTESRMGNQNNGAGGPLSRTGINTDATEAIGASATGVTVPTLNINNTGGGGAHTILPPAGILAKIVVVE
jgi:microcystin-dependent protein